MKGQLREWQSIIAITRVCCIAVLFSIVYCFWGNENHLLYWGLHYIGFLCLLFAYANADTMQSHLCPEMQANEIQCTLWISITKCHFHITSYLTELCVLVTFWERGPFVMLIIKSLHLINLHFWTYMYLCRAVAILITTSCSTSVNFFIEVWLRFSLQVHFVTRYMRDR